MKKSLTTLSVSCALLLGGASVVMAGHHITPQEKKLNHWKALCINPNDKLEVDGFNSRALAPCFLVLINNLKHINSAHKTILNTKYYDKMDGKYKKYLGI